MSIFISHTVDKLYVTNAIYDNGSGAHYNFEVNPSTNYTS